MLSLLTNSIQKYVTNQKHPKIIENAQYRSEEEISALEYIKQKHHGQGLTVFEKRVGEKLVRILNYELIDSTMNVSQIWPRESISPKNIYLFQAQSQTNGQGQNNNKWSSPEGNFYGTFLVQCRPGNIHFYQHLASLVSVEAVDEILRYYNLPTGETRLKWINDIILGDGKVSGVLVRSEQYGNNFYAQIGIGVNLNIVPLTTSTSIKQYYEQTHDNKESIEIDLKIFTTIIIEKLVKYLNIIESNNIQLIKDQYKSRILYLNQNVRILNVELTETLKEGRFLGFDENLFPLIQEQGQDHPTVIEQGRMRI